MDRRSRRGARCQLDHHHGPKAFNFFPRVNYYNNSGEFLPNLVTLGLMHIHPLQSVSLSLLSPLQLTNLMYGYNLASMSCPTFHVLKRGGKIVGRGAL